VWEIHAGGSVQSAFWRHDCCLHCINGKLYDCVSVWVVSMCVRVINESFEWKLLFTLWVKAFVYPLSEWHQNKLVWMLFLFWEVLYTSVFSNYVVVNIFIVDEFKWKFESMLFFKITLRWVKGISCVPWLRVDQNVRMPARPITFLKKSHSLYFPETLSWCH